MRGGGQCAWEWRGQCALLGGEDEGVDGVDEGVDGVDEGMDGVDEGFDGVSGGDNAQKASRAGECPSPIHSMNTPVL